MQDSNLSYPDTVPTNAEEASVSSWFHEAS